MELRNFVLCLTVLICVVLGALACTKPVSETGNQTAGEVAAEATTESDTAAATPADRVHVSPDSDAEAIAIAQSVVETMGGWDNWDRTRYLHWKFFGGRRHYWDRGSGNVRIEGVPVKATEDAEDPDPYLVLMNIHTREGRAFDADGAEVTDPDLLARAIDTGHSVWINDSYWLVMPYKLLDPGVTLRYAGEREMEDGRPADVLELTFTDVGDTPDNKYDVFVSKETGLVEQWSFYARAEDGEPNFTMPWTGWQRFGDVMLATGRGRERDWRIAVLDEVPESVFQSPEPVPEI